MSDLLDALRRDLYGEGYQTDSFAVTPMVGTSLPTAGIPMPKVKAVAKRYGNCSDLPLEEIPRDESVELTMLYFRISLARCSSFEEQMAFLGRRLPQANSWMITDSLPQLIKKVPSALFLPYYREWVASKEEYCKRFAYVEALTHYREEVTPYLRHLRKDESYYVTMAQAWMLATFAITHFEEVVAFLEKGNLPILLRRKTISKMVDSFRISEDEKKVVKKLRDNF